MHAFQPAWVEPAGANIPMVLVVMGMTRESRNRVWIYLTLERRHIPLPTVHITNE